MVTIEFKPSHPRQATYPFIAPQTVAGETGFPVLFAATAETSNPQRHEKIMIYRVVSVY